MGSPVVVATRVLADTRSLPNTAPTLRPPSDRARTRSEVAVFGRQSRWPPIDEVALEFEAAGVVAYSDEAYSALKRCRPARPPVYRDGDLYALDPHDDELDLWAFRLGLRPPRVPRHDPPPEEVVAFVAARTRWHKLVPGPMTFRRTGAAVAIGADGSWSIEPGASELMMARDAVRDAVERAHRQPIRSTSDQIEASQRAAARRRAAHADQLAALRRVIVHAFPARSPRAVVLLDVENRELATFIDGELAGVGSMLQTYDLLCGVDIRATLRELGVDAGDRRLGELGPPQKSIRLNRSGRTLKITTTMLVQGSCGISRPFGDDKTLLAYLANGQIAPLSRRLEADAKSLFALHQYGKVHGRVRLRWGFLDEVFPAPWHHRDEPTLHDLKREAHTLAMRIVAVVGSAPGWEDPWSRARHFDVIRGAREYDLDLVDERGEYIDDQDVQLARLETVVH